MVHIHKNCMPSPTTSCAMTQHERQVYISIAVITDSDNKCSKQFIRSLITSLMYAVFFMHGSEDTCISKKKKKNFLHPLLIYFVYRDTLDLHKKFLKQGTSDWSTQYRPIVLQTIPHGSVMKIPVKFADSKAAFMHQIELLSYRANENK